MPASIRASYSWNIRRGTGMACTPMNPPTLCLTALTKGSPPGGLALLCRARTLSCALPLVRVVETMRPLPIVALAGAPSFVCGVSLIRGEPTPVVDLGVLLGSPEPPCFTRFVTVRAGARQVALAFEEVLRVQDIPSESLATLPPLLRGASESAVSAVGALDADLLFVLEGARSVPDAVWPMLDRLSQ